MEKIKILVVTVFLLLWGTSSLYAHPGGLDSSGCHTNHKTGDYHCHQDRISSSSSNTTSSNSRSVLTSESSSGSSSLSGGYSSSNLGPTEFFVMRTIDGDTIELSNGERVRLIGVDTPETVHPNKPVEEFGKEASAFTKQEIEGQSVRLEYDVEKNDKYRRTLAYVYRARDGFFLNAEIIKQGYGHAYTKFPFKYLEEFR